MATQRRPPGEIRDAIIEFFQKRKGDASAIEITDGISAALKSQVPKSSVRSYLNLNVGSVFKRTARGRYRLARR